MHNSRLLLGVNIDHVATIRQARGTRYPDPIQAAIAAEDAGADGITLHLREDRRHIQDRDVRMLKNILQTRMNLEMAVTDEMLNFAVEIKPEHCCLVPEKREELTTEGGLDVMEQMHNMYDACQRLNDANIQVSLFIDPEQSQIEAAVECRVAAIELHTGQYADAENSETKENELIRIIEAAKYAKQAGLIVNAGHGLHYHNVKPIASIPELNELNIGHSIIAKALFVGMPAAVKQMQQLMLEARIA